MTINLYEALVPNWKQILVALSKLLDKAQQHCASNNLPESALIEARLAPDMFPLGFQIKASVVHSIGAIEAVRKGIFSPDRSPAPDSLAGLKTLISDALTELEKISPAEISSLIGGDMRFVAGERVMDFTAENYLLSFSQPNFFFHAVTAYDILRNQGLAIGKADFLGPVRKKL